MLTKAASSQIIAVFDSPSAILQLIEPTMPDAPTNGHKHLWCNPALKCLLTHAPWRYDDFLVEKFFFRVKKRCCNSLFWVF